MENWDLLVFGYRLGFHLHGQLLLHTMELESVL